MARGVYKRTKPPWNTGLTKKTDERILQSSLKISISNKGKHFSRLAKLPLYNLICKECGKAHQKRLNPYTVKRKNYSPICQDCVNKKVAIKTREKYLEKCKKVPFEILTVAMKKRVIWDEQGEECNHCNFNKYDLKTGPYDLHHIDGDRSNKKRENFEVICKNCHAMTKNYGFKGRKVSKKSYDALIKGQQLGTDAWEKKVAEMKQYI